MQFQGTKYPKGCIVALDSSGILPTFGIIMDIILTDFDNVHFVCEALTTDEFSDHLHSFIVKREKPTPLVICKQDELADYHPLGVYELCVFITTCLYVVPQYHLM